MGIARLAELAWARRNMRRSGVTREGQWSRATYPLVVLIHAVVIVGTAVRGRKRPWWPGLVTLASVQPLRWWVLTLLGSRWNTRGAVPEGMVVETRGPYAVVRHPNYAVVMVELLSLPWGFRSWRLGVVGSVVNAALLAVRIRDEEAALMTLPGYREHFERKARVLPGVW